MRVLTFSRFFPSYHPKAGQATRFVEKIWKGFMDETFALPKEWHDYYMDYMNSLNFCSAIDLLGFHLFIDAKYHTIRAGHRWKAGDYFSPRVWSGKAYRSKQIIIGPDIEIKKTWDIVFHENGIIDIEGRLFSEHKILAKNDGLAFDDFNAWFPAGKKFEGQIISWSNKIEY